MKGAVIYARYSSDRQNEQSIEGQLRVCNKFAEENGLTIMDTYIDRAMTGTNDNRAAFQQMLADCAKPVPWDIVLVYAIDRFGRDSIEISVNKYKLRKHNKTYISATQRTSENIDGTKNLDGILLENMYIGLAEYYSAELSQKVKRGMNENRIKGLYCGGIVPFGYKVENKKVLINEDEANVVRQIFQEYAAGKIAREIIRELTDKGITYRGKPFAINTLYNLLRAEKYIGIYRHDDKIYDNIYPAIIPKKIYDEIQAILAKNKIGSRSNYTEYLLRDKLICGYCGKHLQGESGTARNGEIKHYYKCMGRKKLHICDKSILKKDEIENLIIEVTAQVLDNPENINTIADAVIKLRKEKRTDESMTNLLILQRNELRKSLANIMKAIEEGIFTATTKTRMEELEKQLMETEDKIAIEQYKSHFELTKEQVIEFVSHSLHYGARLMISLLINKIIVFDDRLEIYYNYTEKTNPDNTDRDLFFLSGSDSSNMVHQR